MKPERDSTDRIFLKLKAILKPTRISYPFSVATILMRLQVTYCLTQVTKAASEHRLNSLWTQKWTWKKGLLACLFWLSWTFTSPSCHVSLASVICMKPLLLKKYFLLSQVLETIFHLHRAAFLRGGRNSPALENKQLLLLPLSERLQQKYWDAVLFPKFRILAWIQKLKRNKRRTFFRLSIGSGVMCRWRKH